MVLRWRHKNDWNDFDNNNTKQLVISNYSEWSDVSHHDLTIPRESDVWDWSWKIPNWWRSTTEMRVVCLIGCYLVVSFGAKVATNQRHCILRLEPSDVSLAIITPVIGPRMYCKSRKINHSLFIITPLRNNFCCVRGFTPRLMCIKLYY